MNNDSFPGGMFLTGDTDRPGLSQLCVRLADSWKGAGLRREPDGWEPKGRSPASTGIIIPASGRRRAVRYDAMPSDGSAAARALVM